MWNNNQLQSFFNKKILDIIKDGHTKFRSLEQLSFELLKNLLFVLESNNTVTIIKCYEFLVDFPPKNSMIEDWKHKFKLLNSDLKRQVTINEMEKELNTDEINYQEKKMLNFV